MILRNPLCDFRSKRSKVKVTARKCLRACVIFAIRPHFIEIHYPHAAGLILIRLWHYLLTYLLTYLLSYLLTY